MHKLMLVNPLSPGDILMMTGAIRDLHLTYPDEYETGVRSPCNEIFQYNPYVVNVMEGDGIETIRMEYPIIHQALRTGLHFSDGHRLFLQTKIGRSIKKHSMRPEIYLSQDERNWVSQVRVEFGYSGKFWLINAGIKSDYTLKQYPYYQEVVDLLRDRIQFVQIGHTAHNHPALDGVLDLRGRTDLRQLFRLSHHAEGSINAVSLQMVIMQALRKPCVIVAGGREGMRWQAINDHRYLHTIGALDCCMEDGCWKSKFSNCLQLVDGVPRCMGMIQPEDIVRAVESYYDGGRLEYDAALESNVLCSTGVERI